MKEVRLLEQGDGGLSISFNCIEELFKMTIVSRTERSMVRAMCGAQLIDRKKAKDLMLMLLGLNTAIDQLAMASSVHWYGMYRGGKMVMS